jgi:hypothetical protein
MIYSWDDSGNEGLEWVRAAMRELPSITLKDAYNGDSFFLVGKEYELEQFMHVLETTLPVRE